MTRDLREAIALIKNLPAGLLAFVWRTLLYRTIFIAVTGSLGKTTAKDCLAAMLSRVGPTMKTRHNSNGRWGITRTILRTRPRHRFVVVEVGTDRPGALIRASFLLRPDVALILKVARTHTKEFKTLEGTAAEKVKLLRFMRKGGTAVLNGDDPRVSAMARKARGKVVLFGSSEGFDVWMREASSRWPERLQFTACRGKEVERVRTQLVGTHWLHSVTGAIAAAVACGATLAQAAEAAAEVEPFVARMQPVELPGGAVLLRDEYNGSVDSFDAAFRVLSQAQAQRRMLVISDCSDSKAKPRDRTRQYARLAVQCGAAVVFIGEGSGHGVEHALRAGSAPENAHGFPRWEDAAIFLRQELKAGDLVLLRGRATDHLSRLYFAVRGSVACHKTKCSMLRPCDECSKLGFVADTQNVASLVCVE